MDTALYGAATLRRWARTIVASRDRRVLLGGLVRGVAQGARGPRPTTQVLADQPVVADAVARIEAAAGRAPKPATAPRTGTT